MCEILFITVCIFTTMVKEVTRTCLVLVPIVTLYNRCISILMDINIVHYRRLKCDKFINVYNQAKQDLND